VLILPPGHAESIRVSRRLSRREKRLLAVVVTALAVLVAMVVIAVSSGGQSSARGCIYVTIPAPTGAQEISQCGAAARSTCATAGAPGAFSRQAAGVVASECRKAGLPVGR
jgi:hypothetical protein